MLLNLIPSFSTSVTSWLERFQVTCNTCLFSKILLNAHLFVQYWEAEVYKIQNWSEVHWLQWGLYLNYFGSFDPLPVELPV